MKPLIAKITKPTNDDEPVLIELINPATSTNVTVLVQSSGYSTSKGLSTEVKGMLNALIGSDTSVDDVDKLRETNLKSSTFDEFINELTELLTEDEKPDCDGCEEKDNCFVRDEVNAKDKDDMLNPIRSLLKQLVELAGEDEPNEQSKSNKTS